MHITWINSSEAYSTFGAVYQFIQEYKNYLLEKQHTFAQHNILCSDNFYPLHYKAVTMPRQKISYLSDMIGDDEIDDDQYVNIAFVPNEDESSDSDNATESDIEEEILSRLLPVGHYEQIKSSYTTLRDFSLE